MGHELIIQGGQAGYPAASVGLFPGEGVWDTPFWSVIGLLR